MKREAGIIIGECAQLRAERRVPDTHSVVGPGLIFPFEGNPHIRVVRFGSFLVGISSLLRVFLDPSDIGVSGS